jgi:hypothetical protein
MMTGKNVPDPAEPPSTGPIRVTEPEPGGGPEPQYLLAEFQCLARVDHDTPGGLRDTIAQVVARWREVFRQVTIEVPRPTSGVRQLPYVCPMCGKPVELQARSWPRTTLGPLCGLLALALALAVLGLLNAQALGAIGVGVCVAGVAFAGVILAVALLAPGLLDSPQRALRIVKDVSRDPSMFPIPGVQGSDRTDYRELRETGRNQHKLDRVRVTRRG